MYALRDPPENPHDASQHDDVVGVDRRHRRVGGLQPDVALLAVDALDGGLAAIDERGDDLAVLGGLLTAHDDVIAAVDAVVDHRLTAYAQEEVLARRGEQ